MPRVEIFIPDDLWDQLLGRVKLNPKTSPSEYKRATAKEIRLLLSTAMGPNPKSVIHAIKAKERGEDPPEESLKALGDIKARMAAELKDSEAKRAETRRKMNGGPQ